VFLVLDGRATFVTGGVLEQAHNTGPGDLTGVAISGGSIRELRAGDVVHVPAGVPYEMLVAGEKAFTYLALKISEKDRE
jgi:mannose-6-phosphate isomerase-like protein (cupin superfamily)